MECTEEGLVFLLYYVNQERLLDLYAILNRGYAEYEEVSSSSERSKSKNAAAKAEGSGGFKIFSMLDHR